MARKGNQQKNGLDRHTSKHKKKSADSIPSVKGHAKTSEAKIFPGDQLSNGKQRDNPSVKTVKADLAVDANSNKQKHEVSMGIKNHAADDNDQLISPESDSMSQNMPQAEASGSSEGKEMPSASNFGPQVKTVLSCLMHSMRTNNPMENMGLAKNCAIRNLRVFAVSVSREVIQWFERQRPYIIAMTSNICKARDKVRSKFDQAYPIVLKWLMHLGSIILLISLLWLDSAIRGLDSFLRMGTTSFFSLVWCSILSVIAMVGFSKFLMVLVAAAVIAVFLGFTLGILTLAASGSVLLWLYGSFWTTILFIFLGGLAFMLSHERLALFITTSYSIYCACGYVGWLGLLLALNLSFISSDALIYFIKNNINQPGSDGPTVDPTRIHGESGFFGSESVHGFENGPGFSGDRGPGVPSTSGTESELNSEDEVARLLHCTDHYSVLGLSRYDNIDATYLKREYRKKAMLVHPDKNMGNEKAAEAFKKLQNAYEVLLDSIKRKTYDDELRREELLNYFRRFQCTSQKSGGHGTFGPMSARPEAGGDDAFRETRQIACKKCGHLHAWLLTKKSKSRARWCQDCKDFHLAKDGDGWVEQSSQPIFFGLFQKVDVPAAYICADSKIYDATEWYICQGMRCPANTHKSSFHVNTSMSSKHSAGKGTNPGQRGGRGPASNMEETMTEEEFFEWLQNAAQSGMFDNFSGTTSTDSPTSRPANGCKPSSGPNASGGSSNSKKKKKGKRQW